MVDGGFETMTGTEALTAHLTKAMQPRFHMAGFAAGPSVRASMPKILRCLVSICVENMLLAVGKLQAVALRYESDFRMSES